MSDERGVNETGKTIIKEVEFCGCTNEKLERGETCGQPQCPNIEAVTGALEARGVTKPLWPDQIDPKTTHAVPYLNGAGKEVWKVVSREGKVLQEDIGSDSDMRAALIEHRKVEGDFRETIKPKRKRKAVSD